MCAFGIIWASQAANWGFFVTLLSKWWRCSWWIPSWLPVWWCCMWILKRSCMALLKQLHSCAFMKIILWLSNFLFILGTLVTIQNLQAFTFLLALVVRAANRPTDYDSDDEYIPPRPNIRQPLLINIQGAPATGIPVLGSLDQHPGRNDAWSMRLREKVRTA